jgi:DNA-binding LytR/AlgR family response regulator
MSGSIERRDTSRQGWPREGRRDGGRLISDWRQWLGMSGEGSGTNGVTRRTLLYGYSAAVVAAGAACALHVITAYHQEPQQGLAGPTILEGTSWVSLSVFLWIIWLACRIAPLSVRPRWKLLVHVPAALLFSLAHVAGFVAIRHLLYALAGAHYAFGAFFCSFPYELSKDTIAYVLFAGMFTLFERLLSRQSPIEAPGQRVTFDIRDGAKLTRVRLNQIVAIVSAGNYVEFVLTDGRKSLMRSPLSALERELASHGFLRTHRSWLVNAGQVTALKPAGSGDYTVELGHVTAPLSRRFPVALAKLRSG